MTIRERITDYRERFALWREDMGDGLSVWSRAHMVELRNGALLVLTIIGSCVCAVVLAYCNSPMPSVPDAPITTAPTVTATEFVSTFVPPGTITLTKTATRTVTWTSTRTPTLTMTLTATPTLSPSPTRTASDTSTFTITPRATHTPSPIATTRPGRDLTPVVGTQTPMLPTTGGKFDPAKCETGYALKGGVVGKDLYLVWDCQDEELLEEAS